MSSIARTATCTLCAEKPASCISEGEKMHTHTLSEKGARYDWWFSWQVSKILLWGLEFRVWWSWHPIWQPILLQMNTEEGHSMQTSFLASMPSLLSPLKKSADCKPPTKQFFSSGINWSKGHVPCCLLHLVFQSNKDECFLQYPKFKSYLPLWFSIFAYHTGLPSP
jgi:hypothetical protein